MLPEGEDGKEHKQEIERKGKNESAALGACARMKVQQPHLPAASFHIQALANGAGEAYDASSIANGDGCLYACRIVEGHEAHPLSE